jgi:hypothetical protein
VAMSWWRFVHLESPENHLGVTNIRFDWWIVWWFLFFSSLFSPLLSILWPCKHFLRRVCFDHWGNFVEDATTFSTLFRSRRPGEISGIHKDATALQEGKRVGKNLCM